MQSSIKPKDFRQEFYSRYVSRFKGPRDEAYDQRWHNWFGCRLLPLLRDVPRDGAILDLGCGAGQMLRLLKNSGFTQTYGVDVSAEQVQLVAEWGLQAEVGDALEYLQRAPARFDAIIALDFVEHFGKSEQLPLFDALFAALKAGGKLILLTPNGEGLFAAQVIYGDLTHLTIFTQDSLTQLLRLVGFEDLQFFETGPAPKDLTGRVRALLWRVVRMMANGARLIETGQTQRLWTKNFICCCTKPCGSGSEC